MAIQYWPVHLPRVDRAGTDLKGARSLQRHEEMGACPVRGRGSSRRGPAPLAALGPAECAGAVRDQVAVQARPKLLARLRALEVELLVDVAEVGADRLDRNEQGARDLAVGQSARRELGDPPL